MRSRSDLFNSGGGGQKGEGIFSKFREELAKRGVKKCRGVWTLDEAMTLSESAVCGIFQPISNKYCNHNSTYLIWGVLTQLFP